MPEKQGVFKFGAGSWSPSYSEFFGPRNFEVGKRYRIVLEKYKKPNQTVTREGVVVRNDVVQCNNARALEMRCVEERRGKSSRNVRRMYSYYKMKEVWELD